MGTFLQSDLNRAIRAVEGNSQVHRSSPIRFRKLGIRDVPILGAFLRTDPVGFIYPLSWLHREGISPSSKHISFHFDGAFLNDELIGASLIAGGILLFMATHEPLAAEALASDKALKNAQFNVLVGPQLAVDRAWIEIERRIGPARVARPQTVFTVTPTTLKRFSAPHLRLAKPSDLIPVLGASLQMHELETFQAPDATEVELFRRGVSYQISEQRIYVWTENDGPGLLFKTSVSAMCDAGAQLEGVFVPTHHRRCGYARRALSELCQRLFEHVEVVSLYVNVENDAAIRLYRDTLGFEPVMPFKTVFFNRREKGSSSRS